MLNPFFGAVSSRRVSSPAPLAASSALLEYLGLSVNELRKIWWYRSRMYHTFDISKRGGKTRSISAPDKRLKYLQRMIAELLDQLYSPRNPVHGFVSDRSVITNALAHGRGKFVINLDIANFFPSIGENRISGLLKALGVESDVAQIIARICTNNGMLPQGAPSSPVLSNMICFRLDKELLSIAKRAHCIYTRYADDITFSSYQPPGGIFNTVTPPPGRFDPILLHPSVISSFTDNGFTLNPEKAHYADRYSRRTVTGVKINQGLNVDRRFIRNIRSALFSVESLGLEKAQEKFQNEYNGRGSIAQFLVGKIGWVGCVKGQADPVFRNLAERYNKSFPHHLLKVQPTPIEVRNRAVWVVEHAEGEWAQGSAFFLKDVGLVTAWHCVEEAIEKEIDLYHPSKPSNLFKVRVKKHHVERDLAILEHNVPLNEYFELRMTEKDFSVGDTLTAVGYPNFAPGDGLNIRAGQISSFSVKRTVPLIEVTQKLTQGMSGGPVLDHDGNVAGVIHKGGPAEGRDFAIDVNALVTWLTE